MGSETVIFRIIFICVMLGAFEPVFSQITCRPKCTVLDVEPNILQMRPISPAIGDVYFDGQIWLIFGYLGTNDVTCGGPGSWYSLGNQNTAVPGMIFGSLESGYMIGGRIFIKDQPITIAGSPMGIAEATATGRGYIVGRSFNRATGEFVPASELELLTMLHHDPRKPEDRDVSKDLPLFSNRESTTITLYRNPDDGGRIARLLDTAIPKTPADLPWIAADYRGELIVMYELESALGCDPTDLSKEMQYATKRFRFYSGNPELNRIFQLYEAGTGGWCDQQPSFAFHCSGIGIHRFAQKVEGDQLNLKVEDWSDYGGMADYDDWKGTYITGCGRTDGIGEHFLTIRHPVCHGVVASPAGQPGGLYADGQSVQLAVGAIPNGVTFSHWTSNDPGVNNSVSPTITLTMNGDRDVEAHFTPDLYSLYVLHPPGAEITATPAPSQGSCGLYVAGTQVTLVVAASPVGKKFDHWKGGPIDGSTSKTVTLTITQDESVVAVFVDRPLCFFSVSGQAYDIWNDRIGVPNLPVMLRQFVIGGQDREYTTTTGVDGRYLFSNIESFPEGYGISASPNATHLGSPFYTFPGNPDGCADVAVNLPTEPRYITLTGTVARRIDGSPVPSATVQVVLAQRTYSANTDAGGHFTLRDMDWAGASSYYYTISASAAGYVPSTRTLSLSQGDQVVGVTLDPVVYSVSGTVRSGVNASPLQGAIVRCAEISGISSTTGAQGTYTLQGLISALGNYNLTAQKAGFVPSTTVIPAQRDNDLTNINFTLIPCLDFTYTPGGPDANPTIGQPVTFTPTNNCGENEDYTWSFGDQSPVNHSVVAVHPFADHGNYVITLSKVIGGTEVSVSKQITIQCPTAPGYPTLYVQQTDGTHDVTSKDVDTRTEVWKLTDNCPTIGTEPVKLQAIIDEYECGGLTARVPSSQITWSLNGSTAETGPAYEHVIAQDDKLTVRVLDENQRGDNLEITFDISTKCDPQLSLNAGIKVRKNGKTIYGDLIFLDNRDHDFAANPIWVEVSPDQFEVTECPCRAGPITFSWDAEFTGDDGVAVNLVGLGTDAWRAVSGKPDTYEFRVQGFGRTKVTLVGSYTVDGVVRNDPKTRTIAFTLPGMVVLCPRYGCTSVVENCKEFFDTVFNAPIDGDIDLSTPFPFGTQVQTVHAHGGGFANKQEFGLWDEGHFAYVRATGDFEFSARIKNPEAMDADGLQAGIMVRPDLISYNKMAFAGLQRYSVGDGNGGTTSQMSVAAIVRKRPRTDVGPCFIEGSTHPYIRVKRTSGVLQFFSSSDGSTWGNPLMVFGETDLTGWDGALLVGVAAAGELTGDIESTPLIEYDKLYFSNGSEALTQPNVIVNSVFADGNLIGNWSFENVDPVFVSTDATTVLGSRTEDANAYEGRFVWSIPSKSADQTDATATRLPAHFVRTETAAKTIRIQLQVSSLSTGTCRPGLMFYKSDGTSVRATCGNYAPEHAGAWTLYGYDVAIPADVESFDFELIDKTITFTDAIKFDNVAVYPVFGSENDKPVTSYTFADGLLQKFQTIQPFGNKDIVASLLIDDDGRVERALPVFVTEEDAAEGALHKVKLDPVAAMRAYYTTVDDARNALRGIDRKPDFSTFREECGRVLYENSPLNRTSKTYGMLASYSLDVEMEYSNDAVVPPSGSSDPAVPPHRTIATTRTHDGKIKREESNAYGQVVKVIHTYEPAANETAKELVSTSVKDVLGRNLSTTSPMGQNCDPATSTDCIAPTTFLYSTLDQVVEASDPDAGKTETMYDLLGNVRFFRDANKAANNEFLVRMYDAYSRVTRVLLVKDPSSSRWTQENADNRAWPVSDANSSAWSEVLLQSWYDEPPSGMAFPLGLSTVDFTNTRGKVVAQYAWSGSDRVDQYYSYDTRGNLKKTWRKIPGLPLHSTELRYNMSGQVIRKITSGKSPASNAPDVKRAEIFEYDELNRLQTVSEDKSGGTVKKLVRFGYWPDGKVRHKDLGDKLEMSMSYRYDAASRLMQQEHQEYQADDAIWVATDKYRQSLDYGPDNNIASQSYVLPAPANDRYRAVNYTYDRFSRLLAADYGQSATQPSGTMSLASTTFDEKASYDDDGRIRTLARGDLANQDPGQWGAYGYQSNNHRLLSISNHVSTDGKDRSNATNYQYDPNGNIIFDKSSNKKIDYDYRNLPVRVTLFESDGVTVKSQLEYLYDADGNRVSKKRVK